MEMYRLIVKRMSTAPYYCLKPVIGMSRLTLIFYFKVGHRECILTIGSEYYPNTWVCKKCMYTDSIKTMYVSSFKIGYTAQLSHDNHCVIQKCSCIPNFKRAFK